MTSVGWMSLACAAAAAVLAGRAAAQGVGGPPAAAPVLAAVFADHMVLQRDRPVRLWGHARPGAEVTLTLQGREAVTKASADGDWQAVLPAHAAGGPYELTVAVDGRPAQTLHDVLLGDVWLCSGQSNMEFQVAHVTNAVVEMQGSANDRIRLLQIPHVSRTSPAANLDPAPPWRPAGPESVANFSAACFFMGRDLQASSGAPIGLIDASWGGSPAQDWMSVAALRRLGAYRAQLGILAQYAASPQAGVAEWGRFMDAWWAGHDTDGGVGKWTSAGFDDSGWPAMVPNSPWERSGVEGLAAFDGLVWFRTAVDVPADKAGQAATLELGPIDDMDTTWVNGRPVGVDDVWDHPRRYPVAAGVLKAGRNVLAVRVLDTGSGGGLWGSPRDRALVLADGTRIPLPPAWRYRISTPLSTIGLPPRQPWIGGSGLTTLFNGMIAPLAGIGLKGVAWYQGEANAAEAGAYADLLPGLIADWRAAFRDPALPFLIVQLANYGPPSASPQASNWAALREVQRRTAAADPHAGLALAIDIGQASDIHPTNKQEVGRRLALAARRVAYGEPVVDAGPTPVAARRDGARVAVSYRPGRLSVFGAGRPVGFELCDAAGRCRFVDAQVEGGRVLLAVPAGLSPAKVRFLWADSPVVNLYGDDGLPAVPFEMKVE